MFCPLLLLRNLLSTQIFSINAFIEDKNGVKTYTEIKEAVLKIDPTIKVNPQKYYISLRKNRNFVYMKFRRAKMHLTIMLPIEIGSELIKEHKIKQLSEPVQKFYNGPCFRVTLEDDKNLNEIVKTLKVAYERTGTTSKETSLFFFGKNK